MAASQYRGQKLVEQYGDSLDVEVWKERLKSYAPSTQQHYLYSVHDYLKSLGKDTEAIYKESMKMKASLHEEAKQQTKNTKQEANWLPWKDVLRVREELAKTQSNYSRHLRYLIVCLYTMMPPLRLDWAEAVICESPALPEKGNVVDIVNKKFVLRNYKTVKRHGELRLDIPDELMAVIKKSLEDYPRKALLGQRENHDEPMTSPTLSHTLKRTMTDVSGREMNLQLLRRSYVSHQMEGQPSLLEQEKQALALGHTFAIHQLYRKL